MIKTIFRNQSRLRAGWRILLQILSFLILLIIVQTIQSVAETHSSLPLLFASSLAYLSGISIIIWAFARWIDHRKPVDYGFNFGKAWCSDFCIGFFLGALILTTVFMIEWGLGWLQITAFQQTVFEGSFVLVGIATFLRLFAVGIGEEFTFRGYQIINLAEGLSGKQKTKWALVAALLVTSLLFGAAHMNNPNATFLSGVNITLAGLLLGLGYLLTGELALPIGLHLAWGFFEEFVFGFANSGREPTSSLIASQVTGPELWTGGAFGPEAGLLITLMILIAALLTIAWVKVRGRGTRMQGK